MVRLWLQLRVCIVGGGDMRREGKVQLPQTLCLLTGLEGVWQLRARDTMSPLHPLSLPCVCGGSRTIYEFVSTCVIEWMGSTPSVRA